jgi:penicillin amidase
MTDGLSARAAAYAEDLPGLGHLRLLRVLPDQDAGLIHSWVREERARFWGMNGWSREQVREVYSFLDSLDTHHGYLMTVAGRPAGIFQTYEPLHDPVGEVYPARAEDAGMHLLLAPAATPVPGFTSAVLACLVRFLLADPAKDRVVAEPDERNSKAINRFLGFGFEAGPKVQLADKEGRLVFLDRAAFESRTARKP